MKSDQTIIRKNHMEPLHFITKLLDIKDPNIQILDIINMDTHKEIIAKLDYEAPSCTDCGYQMKKYDFQKPSKIPYLETTGMPTRILLKKASFQVLSLFENGGGWDFSRQEKSLNSSYYQSKDCSKVDWKDFYDRYCPSAFHFNFNCSPKVQWLPF